MQGFEPVIVVTMLILIQLLWFGLQVGKARVKHEVSAPSTDGPPEFQRRLRIQYNTLEQLTIFMPAMWLFAVYVHALGAAIAGVVFLIGRAVYSVAYAAEPKSRTKGFIIGWLAQIVLILWILVVAVMSWLS